MTRKPDFSEIDLYPVTGRQLYGGRSDTQIIAGLASAGVRIIQLREKSLPDRELFELALLYRRQTDRYGMLFIVNDRPDIAMMVKADGAHLGQDDLPVKQARETFGPGMIIGASAHSLEEALKAQADGASYVNMGPVFPTPTKPGAKSIGIGPVRQAVEKVKIPVTVMGGIDRGNIEQLLDAGVRRAGVVRAVFGSDDVRASAGLLRKIISNYLR